MPITSVQEIPEFCRRRNGMFNRYARIFRTILARWRPLWMEKMEEEERHQRELDQLILPSNEDWRYRVYYRLVELQRECDAIIASKSVEGARSEMESVREEECKKSESKNWENWESEPNWIKKGCPLRGEGSRSEESTFAEEALIRIRGAGGSMTEACIQPGWQISDILLAGKVLQQIVPLPVFSDEAEMRRVFGLVYDVLRYKKILKCVLNDVGFWERNAPLKNRERIVWLLLYDMQGRKFTRRGEAAVVKERERIFEMAGLKDIEDGLLKEKTHLAASLSRLRIGGSALNIEELLPMQLRIIEGVSWKKSASLASGWVNTVKLTNKLQFEKEMSKLNLVLREDYQVGELDSASYAFDSFCPKVVYFHDTIRERLAVSELVRDHRFIFLERSVCLGAAALARAFRIGRLCGPVVLTHSVAPRHIAYLAGLLSDIEDAGRLLVFGAGDSRCEYQTYLENLGITLQQCRVFSENYVTPSTSAELERATVVLAIPPCSCTGIKDIVDLAVARGGDIDLLESLTNENDSSNLPQILLADQLSTLKYALTRPNVQFLIYEAHTIIPSETTEMVQQVVDYANRMAREKHILEHPPRKKVALRQEGTAKGSKSSKLVKTQYSQEDEETVSTIPADIPIPDSDLFELASIDEVYGEGSGSLIEPGCFLAVIRRKEMMQFDSLFMIKVAESKGLFGDAENRAKVKSNAASLSVRRSSRVLVPKAVKRPKIEMDRIMAPTYSSMVRLQGSKSKQVCPRQSRYDERKEINARRKVREARKRDPMSSLDANSSTNKNLTYPTLLESRLTRRIISGSDRFEKKLCTIFSSYNEEVLSVARSATSTPRVSKNKDAQARSNNARIKKGTAIGSTVLKPAQLARAVRPIPLTTEIEAHPQNFTKKLTVRRISHIHHPAGSLNYNLFSSCYQLNEC